MTGQQIVQTVYGIAQMIVTAAAVAALIRSGKDRALAPDRLQNERIAKLEGRMDKVEKHLDNDNKRLQAVEEGNRIILQALLAIIEHSLDGNDTDQLRIVKNDLESYLIHK